MGRSREYMRILSTWLNHLCTAFALQMEGPKIIFEGMADHNGAVVDELENSHLHLQTARHIAQPPQEYNTQS